MEEEDEESAINFVPSVCFVKRGISKANPEKVTITQEELSRIITETRENLNLVTRGENADEENEDDDDNDNIDNEMECDNSDSGEPAIRETVVAAPPIASRNTDEYNFDDYDTEVSGPLLHIGDVVVPEPDNASEPDTDEDDEVIKPTDNLILVGHVQNDYAQMEVYVFNEEEDSLYVHHDFLLPSYPLCIEWLNHDPENNEPSNLCAIGSMDPIITIWDLDIQDSLEPVYKLGSKAVRKKQKPQVGHTDAVLDLSWNSDYPHVLASASVDKTVLLWDLDNGVPHTKITSFEEKVQSVKFHPTTPSNLLTGCCDGKIRLFDCRNPDTLMTDFKSWDLNSEIEKTVWNTLDPNYFMAITNDGKMHYMDMRLKAPLWSIQAHTSEASGLILSPTVPGLAITTAADGLLKVWDYSTRETKLMYTKNMKIGKILSVHNAPENPFLFAFGGDFRKMNFKLFDIRENDIVREEFTKRLE